MSPLLLQGVCWQLAQVTDSEHRPGHHAVCVDRLLRQQEHSCLAYSFGVFFDSTLEIPHLGLENLLGHLNCSVRVYDMHVDTNADR